MSLSSSTSEDEATAGVNAPREKKRAVMSEQGNTPRETIEERRVLMQQQDMEYEESLRCDKAKNEDKVICYLFFFFKNI